MAIMLYDRLCHVEMNLERQTEEKTKNKKEYNGKNFEKSSE